jgi:RsiW-degrading membrane proteinase PrsW (M82 family)
MELDDSLETEILLRNALRLGVSARARDAGALAAAIRSRLADLGFRETATCGHCRRGIPDFGVCPYCSAPRSAQVRPEAVRSNVRLSEHFSWETLARSLSQPYFWGVVLLATAPMVLKFFGLDEKWMFIYFSLFWAYVFFKLTHARRALWRAGAIAYIFTGLFALPLLIAWLAVPPHITETLTASPLLPSRLAGFVFGVGVREELTKLIIVVWMMRIRLQGRPLLKTPTDALLIGSLSGLGFAAIENMDYLERFQFMDKLNYSFGLYADNLSFRGSMSRVMLTPFVHAVWSGTLAYFTASALMHTGRARRLLFLLGLAIAAGLHGVYNVFSTLEGGDMFVFAVVALSFAVWLSCYEKGRSNRLNQELAD